MKYIYFVRISYKGIHMYIYVLQLILNKFVCIFYFWSNTNTQTHINVFLGKTFPISHYNSPNLNVSILIHIVSLNIEKYLNKQVLRQEHGGVTSRLFFLEIMTDRPATKAHVIKSSKYL